VIRFDDFKIVPPSRFARLIASVGEEPPLRFIRPEIASIDDAMAWAHDQVWKFGGDFDCRQTVKRLLFTRWLVDQGEMTDALL
jgi:hypothetical protein